MCEGQAPNQVDLSTLLFEAESKIFDTYDKLARDISYGNTSEIYKVAHDEFSSKISLGEFEKRINTIGGHLQSARFKYLGYSPVVYDFTGQIYGIVIFEENYPEVRDAQGQLILKSVEKFQYMIWEFDVELMEWNFLSFPFLSTSLPKDLKHYGFREEKPEETENIHFGNGALDDFLEELNSEFMKGPPAEEKK